MSGSLDVSLGFLAGYQLSNVGLLSQPLQYLLSPFQYIHGLDIPLYGDRLS
jgi:hypothetical protein